CGVRSACGQATSRRISSRENSTESTMDKKIPDGVLFKAADALCRKWNLYHPDAVRMAAVVLSVGQQYPWQVDALEVFRIAGGDTECEPNPTPERALEVLRDLRAC